MNSDRLLHIEMRTKNGKTRESISSRVFELFFLERKRLLSRIPGNPTVRIQRSEKESWSTRRGLRVGTGFREFPQTLRGRGFSLLGFYSFFKYFVDV